MSLGFHGIFLNGNKLYQYTPMLYILGIYGFFFTTTAIVPGANSNEYVFFFITTMYRSYISFWQSIVNNGQGEVGGPFHHSIS